MDFSFGLFLGSLFLTLLNVLLLEFLPFPLCFLRIEHNPVDVEHFVRQDAAQQAVGVPGLVAVMQRVAVLDLVDDLDDATFLLRLALVHVLEALQGLGKRGATFRDTRD